jgi:signal transduction histidine kinase
LVSASELSRTAQARRAGTEFLRIRAVLVAPAMVVLLSALWFSGEHRRRVLAIAGALFTLLCFFVGEAIAFRRRQLTERYLLLSMLITQLGISLVAAASGGLQSPVLPLLLAPTGVALAAFGNSTKSRVILLGLAACLGLLALSSLGIDWPPIVSPLREVMTVLATLLCGVLLYTAIGGLSQAYVSAGTALAATRAALLEEATLRARDLEALGARVAHELKNPLTAAKGLVELVRRHSADAQRERLDVALAELERMQATLRDALDFSRPAAPLKLATFDLETMLRGLLARHEGVAREAGIGLSLRHANQSGNDRWRGDEARLTEVLDNLLLNAVHACSAGQHVEISATTEQNLLRIEVRDDGPGMAEEALAQLGTPFVTTKPGGSGLGVVLARSTIAEHAGSLRYESAPGRGTRAIVELPRLTEEAAP